MNEGQNMVTITLPTEMLDGLIELLTAAKAKAEQDIEGAAPKEEGGLEGLGEELAGSERQPMQRIPR